MSSVTPGTLAHEYQHLINAGRRLYVNNANAFEDMWLNEGLSHIAEELAVLQGERARRRGRTSASTQLMASTAMTNSFFQYFGGNMSASSSFLSKPA